MSKLTFKGLNVEAEKLWDDYWKNPTEEKKNNLCLHYLPFSEYLAANYFNARKIPNDLTPEDIKAFAFLGLHDAVTKYNSSFVNSFTTYAVVRINGAIVDGLRDNSWVPRSELQRAKKEEVKVSRQIHLSGFQKNSEVHGQGRDISGYDLAETRTLTAYWQNKENRKFLKSALNGFNKVERLIILMYYVEGISMKAIGKSLEFSKSRISQLNHQLLARMKENWDSKLNSWKIVTDYRRDDVESEADGRPNSPLSEVTGKNRHDVQYLSQLEKDDVIRQIRLHKVSIEQCKQKIKKHEEEIVLWENLLHVVYQDMDTTDLEYVDPTKSSKKSTTKPKRHGNTGKTRSVPTEGSKVRRVFDYLLTRKDFSATIAEIAEECNFPSSQHASTVCNVSKFFNRVGRGIYQIRPEFRPSASACTEEQK